MHVSQLRKEASHRVVALLVRWSQLAASASVPREGQRATAVPSGKISAEKEALRLLQETMRCVEEGTAGTGSAAADGGASIKTAAGAELLGQRENSLLIWKTLRRQRVPWEETLALAQSQMRYLPTEAQQHFVTRRSDQRPWTVSRAILASWDWQADGQLTEVYHALAETKTMVSFAQEVAKALRSRPQLRQVLPVPLSVLLHAHQLGLPPARTRKGSRLSASKEPKTEEAARMALEVCRRLALLGEASLSTATKERLVLQHTRLLQQCGEWDRALQLVRASPAVRLSVKESMAKYVRERSYWCQALDHASTLSSPSAKGTWVDPAKAVAKAPHWQQALAVVECHASGRLDLLLSTWLTRPDVPLPAIWEVARRWIEVVPEGGALTVEALLRVLRAAVQRPTPSAPEVSAATEGEPTAPTASDYVETAVRLARPTAAQLPGAVLFAAVKQCTAAARWQEALLLTCAAHSYDLALDFAPHVGSAGMPLPLEYVAFEKTMWTLRQPDAAAAADCQPSKDSSLPELLAHALWGNWKRVAHFPRAYTCNRLRSLLAARHTTLAAAEAATNLGPVDCYVFQDPLLTRLVCTSAAPAKRRAFLAQLPPVLRPPFRHLTSAGGDQQDVLERPLTTRDECAEWCAATLKELARLPPPLSVSSVGLLQRIAQKAAAGEIQPRASERYALALAVLEATAPDRRRLDSTTASRAFKSVPAMYSSVSPAALTAGVRGALGLAQWEVALQRYHLAAKLTRGAQADTAPRSSSSSSSAARADATRWLDVCATIALVAPADVAKRHARYLWRRHDHRFSLITLELLHGDSRGVSSELAALAVRVKQLRSRAAHANSSSLAGSLRRQEKTASSKRKALVNAAFTLLNAETPLRLVVRSMGRRHVGATDVDTSALHKVLVVLPWEAALHAMEEVEASGCPMEEVCVVDVAVRRTTPCDSAVLARLAHFLPYAPLLQAVLFVRSAVAERQLVPALKGLLRACHLLEQYPYPAPLRHAFALLLGLVVEGRWGHDGEALPTACTDEVLAKQMKLTRLLFNRILQVAKYTEKVRPGRAEFAISFKEPSAASPLLLLSFLYFVVARLERVPVRASLAARCLHLAQQHRPTDSGAALFFFRQLKRPTAEERMLLVQSLKDSDMAPTLLLNTHRFFQQGFAEQVVVWADVTTSDKWLASLRLLEMRRQATAPDAREEEVQGEKDDTESAASQDGRYDALKQRIAEEYIAKWDKVECARVLELCKRFGYAVPDGTSKTTQTNYFPLADAVIEMIQARMRQLGG